MKKLVLALVLFTFTLGLSACDLIGDVDVDPECTDLQELIDGECVDLDPDPDPDTTAPTLTGVEDATVFVDSDFDPLDGVTANDDTDGDITENITVTGTVDTSATGTYYLLYKIVDAAGNSTQKARYITVDIDPSLIGDEMVPNGDFSLGWSIWVGEGGGIEGGVADFSVTDGVLAVAITTPSWNMWEPRLSNRGIAVEDGMTYEVTFKAKADAARSIHAQVGEILDGPPYFYDFKPGQEVIFDLSTEWQTFTYKFTVISANLNASANLENMSLIFEMGTVEGNVGVDGLATTIYYDDIMIEESTPDPDTIAPLFGGLDALTITQGSTFDPLEGVTANDNLDGALTLDETNVSGTVDTLTAGEYTLTYTVSDAAGNETSEERVITVVAVNFIDAMQIVDGGFDTTTTIIAEVQDASNADITDPDIWYHYTADWDGAAATFAVNNGALEANITASGTNDWALMLKQKGVDLMAGLMYKLTFTASSTVDRDMIARVTDNYGATVQLTSTPTEFEVVFLYDGEDVTGERVIFLLGNTPAFAASTVTIDNVVLHVEGEEPIEVTYVDSMQVVDGGFDTTTEIVDEVQDENAGYADITDPDIWYRYLAAHLSVDASIELVNGAAEITVNDPVGEQWSVMLKQKGFDFVQGTAYKLVFTASATADRDMVIEVTGNAYTTTVNLTSTPTVFEYEFVFEGADVTNERILFLMGATPAFAAGTITIDDVMLYVEEEVVEVNYVDSAQVVDGGFDTTTAIVDEVQDANAGYADITDPDIWYKYLAAHLSVDASATINNGAAEFTVTDPKGEAWSVMLKQKGFDFVQGTAYKLVFTASATADRDMVIEVTGNAYSTTVNLTSTPTVFEYEFVWDSADVTNERILFLMGATPAFAAGTITIDDVMLYVEEEVAAPVNYVDSTQVVDGTFTTTTDIVDEVQDANAGYADITASDIWYKYLAAHLSVDASATINNGAAEFTVTDPKGEAWSVMLKQKGFDFVQGTAYKLVFTASATADRDMVVEVTGNAYTTTVNLTSTPTVFEFEFVFTGADVTNERILFLMGATPAFAAGTITIDDVMLYVEEVPTA
jgi:3-methyladenine DNA glycosylase Tag